MASFSFVFTHLISLKFKGSIGMLSKKLRKDQKRLEGLRAWTNGKCFWRPNTIKHCLVTKHFNVWTPCLVLFDRVWLNLRAIKHSIKNVKHVFCSRVWWAMFCSFGQPLIKHVWSGHATTRTQRLVSIVLFMFDEKCFNRLATHFNSSMFGHQTMFYVVWSSNISRLSRP